MVTIHVLYGDNEAERRHELVLLDDVVDRVQKANGDEQDVVLLGDFNFPPDDFGWQLKSWTALFQPPIRTNIWINPTYTSEYARKRDLVRFDQVLYGGDLQTASREISDHRPVWAEFNTDKDYDQGQYGNLASLTTAGIKPEVGIVLQPPEKSVAYPYVASKNSKVFHRVDCPAVRKIKPENRIYHKTRAFH